LVTGLAGGCALLLLATLVSGCAPPQYTYIADSSAAAYFKVPHYWQQVSPADLCTAIEAMANASTCPTDWTIAYADSRDPSGFGFQAWNLSQPFVYSQVSPYTSSSGTPLTEETLQDFYLPFTAQGRENAIETAEESGEAYPLTGFKQLRDTPIRLSGGYYGFRETYDYTFAGEIADTYDEDILTNAAGTTIYFLLVHCTTSCYSQAQTAIDAVMSSFTVRSP
jgi:hypothetical protein